MGLISNIQDKISHNKDPNVNASYTQGNTSSGLTGQGSHGTSTTSSNRLSSNTATHGNSGISGGTHPLVSGDNTNPPRYGSGEGSHLASSTGQHHHNTGLTGSQHTGNGLDGTSHSGNGLTGSSHTGSGLTSNTHHTGTGVSHVEDNRGMMDKAKDVLSSKRTNHPDDPITGTNFDQKNRGDHTSGSGFAGGATHGTSSHHTQANNAVDFVPGSHPDANNNNAIPTAGGHKLGGVGEGVTHPNTHAGAHQTVGDRVQNALPGQHGNAHDAYGNSINPSSTGAHTFSNQPAGSHTAGGLPGSHTSQSGAGYTSSAQPLSHDSNFNERHSGPGIGSGLAAGAVGGAGHHHSHNQTGSGNHNSASIASQQQHGNSGFTGSNIHNTTTGTGHLGEDNRGIMDKAKDTLSSKRSNQPDDPITGTNYDQKNRNEYTHGSQGNGLTGNSHNTHQPGIAGITTGVNQTHLGSNTTHSDTHNNGLSHDSSNVSHVGRSAEWKEGYQAGYREATLSLGGSHSSTGAHSGAYPSAGHDAHSSTTTGYNDHATKPTLGQKLNPKIDADHDGKAGFMD